MIIIDKSFEPLHLVLSTFHTLSDFIYTAVMEAGHHFTEKETGLMWLRSNI